MTLLVNGKADWRNDHKKEQNTILSTSSGPQGGSNSGYSSRGKSASGGNKKEWNLATGEPIADLIHGVNITGLYGNMTSLPRITRDWFSNNKTAKCPHKFNSKSNFNSNSKFKK